MNGLFKVRGHKRLKAKAVAAKRRKAHLVWVAMRCRQARESPGSDPWPVPGRQAPANGTANGTGESN